MRICILARTALETLCTSCVRDKAEQSFWLPTAMNLTASRDDEDDYARYGTIYRPFSHSEHLIAIVLGDFVAMLSVFGSVSIMYMIIKKNKLWSGPQHVFHRIMWFRSLSDFVSSVSFILQPFFVPTYTRQPLAIGNTATCEIAGFFSVLSISSHMYSCILSIYFMLILHYFISVAKASRLLEPWIHIIAWSFPAGLGMAAAITDVFNPRPLLGVCLTGHFPADCNVNPAVPCQRGGKLRAYLAWSLISLSVTSGLVGIICTWVVRRSVTRQFRRSERFDFRRSITGASPIPSDNDCSARRRQAVAKQAVWYTLAFMNPFFVSLFGSLLIAAWTSTLDKLNNLHNSSPTIFASVLLIDMCYSLQGFLNWVIYIHPTLARWRDAFPDHSALWAYGQMLAGKPTPITRRTEHLVAQVPCHDEEESHLGDSGTGGSPDGEECDDP